MTPAEFPPPLGAGLAKDKDVKDAKDTPVEEPEDETAVESRDMIPTEKVT